MTRAAPVGQALGASLSLVLFLVATASFAGAVDRHRAPVIQHGLPYDLARRALRARGFIPVRVGHAPDDPTCWGGTCTSYPEVMACAGTGTGPCNFAFMQRATGRLFVVSTNYEHPRRISRCRAASSMDLEEIRRGG